MENPRGADPGFYAALQTYLDRVLALSRSGEWESGQSAAEANIIRTQTPSVLRQLKAHYKEISAKYHFGSIEREDHNEQPHWR